MGQGRLYAGGLLGGLTTQEIARAFLVGEPTVAQRIVRAKRILAEAHVAFEVPRGDRSASGWRRCSRSYT
jgi:predicted RNA polymerase sigma factor